MAEYDLVCDACGGVLTPGEAVVSWTARDGEESAHQVTHQAHVPAAATERVEARAVMSPNGYLSFVGERLERRIADASALRALLWALAPFVMRPDDPAEMDAMRAASFGARVGVKPGEEGRPRAAAQPGGGK